LKLIAKFYWYHSEQLEETMPTVNVMHKGGNVAVNELNFTAVSPNTLQSDSRIGNGDLNAWKLARKE
jgi:hypothetical protein